MPNAHPMRWGPQPCCRRAAQMAASCTGLVHRGLRWGRLDRSCSASRPPSRNRRTHLEMVARETRNKRATSTWGMPASTCWTNSARVTGVSRALRWIMRSLLSLWVSFTPTATSRLLTCQQPLWELQLNQYQGGMCISGVLKTTGRTPRHLVSPITTTGWPPTVRSSDMCISPWL